MLIIEVKEWPVISSITVKGNKEIKDENINQVLDKLELKPGHPFNQVTINQFIASLKISIIHWATSTLRLRGKTITSNKA